MAVASTLRVLRADPLCAESPVTTDHEARTPTAEFYVRNNFPMPATVPALTISGAVASPRAISAEEFRQFPRRGMSATLECAGNGRSFMQPPVTGEPWGLGAVSTADWEGARLLDVLEFAGLQADAVEIVFRGADGFARSLPMDRACHADTLLADHMNGQPLTIEHGAPLRLLVPGWYGMASVKWLAAIEAVRSPFQGHFQVERYVIGDRPVREMQVRSLILDPPQDTVVPPGPRVVRGLAWSGTGEVTSVELSDDGGSTWTSAPLVGQPRPYAWRRWELQWKPKKLGPVALLSRAQDSSGGRQPLAPVWNALGYANNAAIPHRLRVGGRDERAATA